MCLCLTTISALKYLYKLEIKKKLTKGEQVDIVSVKASVSPLNTSNLTEKQRLEIRKSVNNDRLK